MHIFRIIGFIGILGIGIMQFFAIMDGLEKWLGFYRFFSLPIALFLAYMPIIGTILGFMGAIKVWGWNVTEAAILFFGFPITALICIYAGALWDRLQERRYGRKYRHIIEDTEYSEEGEGYSVNDMLDEDTKQLLRELDEK